MIPGYNHNVKYKGRVYHVQTEDSGIENPHIITHLFVGGNIVETRKTSYADIAKSERLSEMLVELMQDQHKTMLRDLIGGRFDQRIAERSVNAATLNGPAPLNVEAGAQLRSSILVPVDAMPSSSHGPAAQTTAEAAAAAAAAAAQRGAGAAARPATRPPTGPTGTVTRPAGPATRSTTIPTTTPATRTTTPIPLPTTPTPARVPPATIPSVFALPATRAPSATPPPARSAPPPAAAGSIGAAAMRSVGTPPPPARRPTSTPVVGPPPPARATARPQSPMVGDDDIIQAETLQRAFESKNESAVDSIFGEDLISEKSLDEVILSYLAEDMQKE